MLFKRGVQRYGHTPEPATPFQRAGQLWDDRLGSARAQAHSWRLMAFGGLGLSAAMGVVLMWQASQSRITPYVVEVDRLGEARAVSEAERAWQPTDPQIAWHLARFIEDVRSKSLDPVLMRRDWLAAYGFATARGARFLDAYARSADPFADLGQKTASVQVTSVVRASDRSFQVKWIETAFDRGNKVGDSHWTAILSIVTVPPTSAEALRRNPLGIYVDGIDWSRELDPAFAATQPPASESTTAAPNARSVTPSAPETRP